MLRRVDLPQFLQADAVDLRVDAVTQAVLLHQLLAQMAVAALGEEGVFGMQFHAALIVVGVRAVAAHTHVAGGHALDRAGIVKQHFGAGEPGVDFHAQLLGLAAQPAAHVAQAHHVVAVVLEDGGQGKIGHLEAAGFGEEHETVFTDGLVQGGAVFLPARPQFIDGLRVHYRA